MHEYLIQWLYTNKTSYHYTFLFSPSKLQTYKYTTIRQLHVCLNACHTVYLSTGCRVCSLVRKHAWCNFNDVSELVFRTWEVNAM